MRNNSFDLIRHLAALMVLVSHHFALSGLEEPGIAGYNSLGGIAVTAFFSISGLLISQSFFNSRSFADYLGKRVVRIFPALILCAFVMTYLAGAVFADGYVASFGALVDFLRISVFGRANIEPITQGFIVSESFNGSLWTLKIEFGFYLLLALALGMYRRALMPWVLLAVFAVATYALGNHVPGALAQKLAVYSAAGIAFFAGAVIAFNQQYLSDRRVLAIALVTAAGLIFFSVGTPLASVLATLGVCLATLSLGLLYVDKTIRRRFDISYGMYLYAFPVQQLIINKTSLTFIPSMLVSALIVMVLATVSWRLVEQPALQFVHRRKHALATTQP
ncbi:acyltransferase family protein [Pseudomonas syringae]|uniref:acyltransferase family protein n=1 Tax=Pseudomonas syringae TaxID=317 RepID=UPI001F368CF6|nr:acyltransferase [Pseudomonas syringae]MCF5702852.1 acyltransferase family protein [Pseudomonas syringae]